MMCKSTWHTTLQWRGSWCGAEGRLSQWQGNTWTNEKSTHGPMRRRHVLRRCNDNKMLLSNIYCSTFVAVLDSYEKSGPIVMGAVTGDQHMLQYHIGSIFRMLQKVKSVVVPIHFCVIPNKRVKIKMSIVWRKNIIFLLWQKLHYLYLWCYYRSKEGCWICIQVLREVRLRRFNPFNF